MTQQLWYPFYWGKYSTKTMHLTQGQHGAYLLLLRYIYTSGKPIPSKQCYSIARAVLDEERANVDFILAEFFTNHDELWSSNTASEVMAEADQRHEKRVKSGSKGGKRRSSNAKATLKPGSSNAQADTLTLTAKEVRKKTPSEQKKIPLADVTLDMVKAWTDQNIPSGTINLERELLKFKNHDFKRKRTDGIGTFQNWLLTALDRFEQSSQTSAPKTDASLVWG